MSNHPRPPAALQFVALLLATACGGGSGGGTAPPPPPPPPPPPAPVVVAKASPSGDGQLVLAGQPIASPLRVRVTRSGAPVSGQAITWSASAGAISGNGASNSEGIATASWVLGPTAGTQTATAAAGTSSTDFTATATVSLPGPLGISPFGVTGDGQTGNVGSQLANQLRVRVTRGGVVAGGELVIWQTDGANSFFDPPQTTSAADGIATSYWTLGTATGVQRATAFAGSLSGPTASFSATAVALPPGSSTVKLFTAGGARFEPATLVVPAGTTVTFVWQDGFHDLLSTGTPSFASFGNGADPPKSYQVTFAAAGTYKYYCSVHGSPNSGMRGTVIVQ